MSLPSHSLAEEQRWPRVPRKWPCSQRADWGRCVPQEMNVPRSPNQWRKWSAVHSLRLHWPDGRATWGCKSNHPLPHAHLRPVHSDANACASSWDTVLLWSCYLLGARKRNPSEASLFLSLLSPLPSLPAVKALTIWVTEPVWGFCLMFRVSIQTLHPGIGEVTGSGLHWSDYEQDSSQSSIYHPTRRCTGPPGVNVSSALMSQIS